MVLEQDYLYIVRVIRLSQIRDHVDQSVSASLISQNCSNLFWGSEKLNKSL